MSYATLNMLFLAAVCTVTVVLTRRAGVGVRWWTSVGLIMVALLVLTVIFDSIIIMTDMVRYDESLLVGVTIWHTPIEDLAWPVAAALLLPALWTWLGSRKDAGS